MKALLLVVIGAATLAGEVGPALLPEAQAIELCQRVMQLMDSSSTRIADLQVSTAALRAGAKNTVVSLEKDPGNSSLNAQLSRQIRAFLAVVDATFKPFPLDPAFAKEVDELRASQNRFEAHLAALIASKEALLRSPDPDNVKRYAEENARILAPGVNPRVVFMGDGTTELWRLNEYFTGRDFVNRGIGGQITSEMLGRIQTDVVKLNPRAVLILGGTDDIARGVPLDIIENNLIMMADLARVHQIRVLIATVLPAGENRTERPVHTIQQMNSWIEQFCRQTGARYVDYYSKLRTPAGYLKAEFSDDGVNPNSQGYRIMGPIALDAIESALGRTTTPVEAARHRRVRVF